MGKPELSMTERAYLAVDRRLDDGTRHARLMRDPEYNRAVERAREWRAFAPGTLREAVRGCDMPLKTMPWIA